LIHSFQSENTSGILGVCSVFRYPQVLFLVVSNIWYSRLFLGWCVPMITARFLGCNETTDLNSWQF
jgi:hypothetical protein